MNKFIYFIISILAFNFSLFSLEQKGNLIPVGNSIGYPHAVIIESHLQREWVIELDDDSFWTPLVLEKRQQTWSEWWNNATPPELMLDDRFFINSQKWDKSTYVQVYEAHPVLYPEYPYVLENLKTGEMVFAKLVSPNEIRLPKMEAVQKFFDNPMGSPFLLGRNLNFLGNLVMLNEGAIWQLYPVDPVKQSWGEWWNGLKPEQPDVEFLVELQYWKLCDPLQIYYFDIDTQKLASTYKLIQRSSTLYLMENQRTGQLAYVRPVSAIEFNDLFLSYAFNEYKRGVKEGYNSGYSSGYSSSYSIGYSSGYNEGYDKGFEAGKNSKNSNPNDPKRE